MKVILNSLIKQHRGMALLMVITSVALMTIVLADLSFETQLNKIKIYNLQDRTQAKLNAEAGLKFALAKLKLYQQAINLIEKEKSLKDIIKPSALESVVTSPFMFPIPELPDMSLIQKTALKEFSEKTVLKGRLNVSMRSVSGFLNPNNMRIFKQPSNSNDPNNQPEPDPNQTNQDENSAKKSPQQYIEDKIVERLKTAMDGMRENNDIFDAKYGNLNEELLVKELKYYVSNPEDFNDPEITEIESLYSSKNIKAKNAPMTSIDEMYMLEGWPDDVVNLIINDLTVHEVSVIQVNNINKDQLKIVFPDITAVQIEEFFKYRDGDPDKEEDPRPFKNEEDFKNVVTSYLGIIGVQAYDERVKELQSAGLRIGVAGKLFRVESTGEYERAIYKIIAFVDLPIKPQPKPKKKKDKNEDNDGKENPEDDEKSNPSDDDKENDNNSEDKQKNKKEKEMPREYLEPRVIEIRLN